MDLVTVPVKAELTEIEEFVLDHCLDYGIIAGGFAAYLFNPEKKAGDIDLFVNEHVDSDAYDRLYHHLGASMSFFKKMKWRMVAGYPTTSRYNDKVGLQSLTIWDYTKKGKPGHSVKLQMVTHMDKGDNRHATTENILESFDWNVCRAAVVNKSSLLVDKHFITDMEANMCTFRPHPPRKTHGEDYGFRLIKYIEFKGYNMPFKDMLLIFGLAEDKKKFYDQVFNSRGHKIHNKNLIALGNYIKIMYINDPMWRNNKGDF